jgi:predicted DNA binding CopG/RHH family protein
MTAKEPQIGKYYDDEEKVLIEAIENGAYLGAESRMTPARKAQLQDTGKTVSKDQRATITLQLPEADLSKLKDEASRAGVPYREFIESILHKAAQAP